MCLYNGFVLFLQPDENTLMQFGLGAQNTINDVSSQKSSSSQNTTPYRERGKQIIRNDFILICLVNEGEKYND